MSAATPVSPAAAPTPLPAEATPTPQPPAPAPTPLPPTDAPILLPPSDALTRLPPKAAAIQLAPMAAPGVAPAPSRALPVVEPAPQRPGLQWGKITSPALATNLLHESATKPYGIYLPPSYTSGDRRYPVIYVLHGYTGNATSLTSVIAPYEAMLRAEKVGEMILVFVDGSNRLGGSYYQSSPTVGDVETYIVSDLVGHVDAMFRTLADRGHRGITGFSMGGYGAMRLALKYPDVFGAVVAEGGLYDMAKRLTDMDAAFAEAVGRSHPKDLDDLCGISDPARRAFAMAAAMASHPERPPLFLENPYEIVDGRARPVPHVLQHMAANDVRAELARYAGRTPKLNGIQIIHGRNDDTVPVAQAQALHRKMTELGINHAYEEHDGGHTFIPERAFQFLWDHLSPKS